MGLFTQLVIRNKEVKNRVVLPPMATSLATPEGEVTPEILEHYQQYADGEVGTVIVEHAYVRPDGRVRDDQLGIHEEARVPGLRKLADRLRGGKARSLIQLTHAGARSLGDADGVVWGAGSVTSRGEPGPTPLPQSGLEDLTDAFVRAAERAIEAGFDGVQLHGAHGYLLNQFLSPLTNDRTDAFGGDLAGRGAFPLMVIRRVRRAIGPEAWLSYRLGADDQLDGGLTLEETTQFAQELAAAGVDIVDVSGGLGGPRPEDEYREGFFLKQAKAIKAAIGDQARVIVTGGFVNAETADEAVRLDGVDLVGVGRILLADPYWVLKARARLLRSA